ncbi:homeobox protein LUMINIDEPENDENS [Lycium barbarum]|uniref:homeobox protein LUMINIDEPENDENS n=1 Tax=Lycium barbarum TaxID=112863 RepID=UPI00293EA154|nr:homeobox protein LUMINIDEPENDENS [Lycium barbarum]
MENQLQLALSTSPTTTSFMSLFDSQKELFFKQIDQLENIVLHQCNLTGVNPLSQEMAAGALSIKIGKRPRDLLNPKAIKYMQSVFSVKDAINKKETREICARFGVTVTQVRDFFTAQRTRVRKFLRLSREKASISNAPIEGPCAIPLSSDPSSQTEPVPLDSVAPTCTEDGPSCSTQDEVLTGIEETDKRFVDNIFTLMRKEETFSGQIKLMDWILEVQNPSVLFWFLTKGGVMILATWLSQAAVEEQTSLLHIILKVLCHLPLHKAFPVHMSAILQSVNRLRFYRTPDVSNRARILLARWSKMFAKSQAMKKRNGIKSTSDVQDELLLQQSISEVVGDEIWNSKVENIEEAHANLCGTSENSRKLDSPQPVKLLTASSDDSNRRLNTGPLASKNRERRKVQLMEQPSQRTTGRSLGRPAPATQGRPLSADDIQKAKLRAQFMKSKYGKANNDDNSRVKPQAPNGITSPQEGSLHGAPKLQDRPKVDDILHGAPKLQDRPKVDDILHGASKLQDRPKVDDILHGALKLQDRPKVDNILHGAPKLQDRPKADEFEKPNSVASKRSNQLESNPKLSFDVEEPPWKRCKRMQIAWRKPPEVQLSDTWKVCAGSESKEVDIQNNRIRRERETIYRIFQDIPLNPKEPWDREMDPDDTLTPEIPIQQLPDAEGAETVKETEAALASTSNGIAITAEPDVELLAVLLKNPELVYALTSGQAGNLSSEQTVQLLDIIKADGMIKLSSQTDLGRNAEKKVEVSLPSPTPSSDPGTSGSVQNFAKNPFSQRSVMAVREANGGPQFATVRSQESTTMLAPQQMPVTPQLAQQLALLQAAAGTLGKDHRPSPLNPSINQTVPANPMHSQLSASEPAINRNNYSPFGTTEYNLHSATAAAAAATRIQGETYGNIRSSPMPIANVQQQRTISLHSPQMAVSHTQPRPQLQTQSQPGFAAEHMWGTMPGSSLNRGYQENSIPNHYNARVAGHVEPGLQQAAWRGNNYVEEAGFESWSPDNSPVRRQEHVARWNYQEPRMNMRDNYRPPNPGYYSGYRGPDDGGNRRWGDSRR